MNCLLHSPCKLTNTESCSADIPPSGRSRHGRRQHSPGQPAITNDELVLDQPWSPGAQTQGYTGKRWYKAARQTTQIHPREVVWPCRQESPGSVAHTLPVDDSDVEEKTSATGLTTEDHPNKTEDHRFITVGARGGALQYHKTTGRFGLRYLDIFEDVVDGPPEHVGVVKDGRQSSAGSPSLHDRNASVGSPIRAVCVANAKRTLATQPLENLHIHNVAGEHMMAPPVANTRRGGVVDSSTTGVQEVGTGTRHQSGHEDVPLAMTMEGSRTGSWVARFVCRHRVLFGAIVVALELFCVLIMPVWLVTRSIDVRSGFALVSFVLNAMVHICSWLWAYRQGNAALVRHSTDASKSLHHMEELGMLRTPEA